MRLQFEELTHKNYADAQEIDRNDIPESFVDDIYTLMEITDYAEREASFGREARLRLVKCPRA